jgi:transcriptional regulator with XRE-family HTH domain
MAETQRAFARALRKLRKERGLTQEEFGLESGLGRSFVSELEREIKSPSLKTLDTIAVYFGIRLSALMSRLEDELQELEAEETSPSS